ncbi:MAG: PAS domain S-box protein [bacterium]
MAIMQKPEAQLIKSLRRLGVHDQACLIYQDTHEQLATVIPFLQVGLERGEQCVYLTDENSPDTIINELRGSEIDIGRSLVSQSILITRIDTFLTQGGGVRPGADSILRHVSDVFGQTVETAKSKGFSAVRFAIEMTWILNRDYGVMRIRETIAHLLHFLATHDALGLAQYHRNKFDPEIILDVIYTHPIVITNGWVCQNFYLIPPGDFVAPDPVSREVDRVLKNLCDQQRILENLLKSEEKYRLLLERQTDLVCGFNPDGTLTFVNRAYCDYFKRKKDDLIGANFMTFIPDEDRRRLREHLSRFSPANPIQTIQHTTVLPDGQVRWQHWIDQAIFDRDGMLIEFQSVGRDITERKQAEEALQESETKYRTLFESSNDAIFLIQDGRFVDCNSRAEELFNQPRKAILGQTPAAFSPPVQQDGASSHELSHQYLQNALNNIPQFFEWRHVRPDNTSFDVEVNLKRIQFHGQDFIQAIVRDITERKRNEEVRNRLQSQLLHAQKFESLGVLAGGIAHDFNNLLTTILGNAGMIMRSLPADSPVRKYAKDIETASLRASELTSQLLAYAGKGRFVLKPLHMSSLIQDMVHLIEISVTRHVTLQYNLASLLPAIRADAGLIRQVVVSLVTNASEATGEKGGRIRIRTGVFHSTNENRSKIFLGEDLTDGEYVFLEVADTGCGMDAETQAKIFDPFFSTKFTGRGLGLAAVLGIVRGHGGSIQVQSQPGEGSRFTILFPAAGEARAMESG